jgi:hypothetical protein
MESKIVYQADSMIWVEEEVLSHDGKQYCFIGIDEGQYITEFEFWTGVCRRQKAEKLADSLCSDVAWIEG